MRHCHVPPAIAHLRYYRLLAIVTQPKEVHRLQWLPLQWPRSFQPNP